MEIKPVRTFKLTGPEIKILKSIKKLVDFTKTEDKQFKNNIYELGIVINYPIHIINALIWKHPNHYRSSKVILIFGGLNSIDYINDTAELEIQYIYLKNGDIQKLDKLPKYFKKFFSIFTFYLNTKYGIKLAELKEA